MRDAEAWSFFSRIMEKARRGPADGLVPVALIMAPSGESRADGMDVDVTRLRLLWPADFPLHERGPLLARAAKAYERPDEITRIVSGEDH